MLALPNSLRRVMLRAVLRRPFQAAMFILGVALGVAMIVAIDIANASALRAFGIFTESLVGRATHQIVGGPSGVPYELYRQLRLELGIREAAPVVTAYAQALELDGQPLRLFGIDPFAEAPFRGYLNLGAANANADINGVTAFLTQPNMVLMAEQLAAQYGLQEGDTLTLRYGPMRHRLTIAGLLRPSDEVTAQGLQDMLIADISTAQEVLNMLGRLTNIDLIIPETPEGEALLARLQPYLPPGVTVQAAGARASAVGQITAAFNLSLTALSLLALVVGMFLIYNTVTFSVVQRRPIIGTLRALGVTRQQIFGMVIWEAALLAAVGVVFGLIAGVLMGRLAVIIVTQTVSSLYFTVTVRSVDIPTLSLIKGALIGVAAAIFAALLPAYEATNTPPSGALKRSDIERKVRRAVPVAALGGALLVAISLAALSLPSLEVNFVAIFGIVVGFSMFTPLVTLVLMNALRPLSGALIGVLGLMAPRSIIRSLSRTSVAIAALMVAVSVIVGISAMVGSFRSDVQGWLADTIRADILISPPSISAVRQDVPVEPSVAEVVSRVEGVTMVGVSRSVDVIRPNDPQPVLLTAIDRDTSMGTRRFVWQIGDYEAVWAALGEGAVMVSETFARQRGIPIAAGQAITLLTDRGEQTFPIAAFMVDYSGDQGTVMLRRHIYLQYYDDPFISTIAAWVAPEHQVSEVVNAIRAAFDGRYELLVQSNRDLRESVLVVFDQTFAITTALNLLATVVAFIGILSALASLQLERTREFGTMRANGMTRRQLFQLTLIETSLMGVIAGVIAVPVGTVLAWVLVYIINLRSFGWTLTLGLRPEFYLQAALVALAASLLAGVYPAWRVGRIQPARALRLE